MQARVAEHLAHTTVIGGHHGYADAHRLERHEWAGFGLGARDHGNGPRAHACERVGDEAEEVHATLQRRSRRGDAQLRFVDAVLRRRGPHDLEGYVAVLDRTQRVEHDAMALPLAERGRDPDAYRFGARLAAGTGQSVPWRATFTVMPSAAQGLCGCVGHRDRAAHRTARDARQREAVAPREHVVREQRHRPAAASERSCWERIDAVDE